MFPSALRVHNPVNVELDQVLGINVGNTAYFQMQASLFLPVAILCLLYMKCVFSSWLTARDWTCRLFLCTSGLCVNGSQPAGIKMHPGKKKWCHLSEAGTNKSLKTKWITNELLFTWKYLQEAPEAMSHHCQHFLLTDSLSAGTYFQFRPSCSKITFFSWVRH